MAQHETRTERNLRMIREAEQRAREAGDTARANSYAVMRKQYEGKK